MTRAVTSSELWHRRLDKLQALFRTLRIELGRSAFGSSDRAG
jgi:hypothetical protein